MVFEALQLPIFHRVGSIQWRRRRRGKHGLRLCMPTEKTGRLSYGGREGGVGSFNIQWTRLPSIFPCLLRKFASNGRGRGHGLPDSHSGRIVGLSEKGRAFLTKATQDGWRDKREVSPPLLPKIGRCSLLPLSIFLKTSHSGAMTFHLLHVKSATPITLNLINHPGCEWNHAGLVQTLDHFNGQPNLAKNGQK